ncbi:uncharacterized protein LOC125555892 [Triticum urartu]|uniref:uncharacterized protein LOC125555892 n=1 Tax=Triticum urartu TaxID=4572 RepID=UPI002043C714|nr:uncharacterized protein LOC125555892 [Triticum urartu]
MSQGQICKKTSGFSRPNPRSLVLLLQTKAAAALLPDTATALLPRSPAAAASCSATAAATRLPPQASPFLKKTFDFPSYRHALLRLRQNRRRRARRHWIRTTTNNLKGDEADKPDDDRRCSKLNADEPNDDGKLKAVDLRAWKTTTTGPQGIRSRRRLLCCFSGGRPVPATPRLGYPRHKWVALAHLAIAVAATCFLHYCRSSPGPTAWVSTSLLYSMFTEFTPFLLNFLHYSMFTEPLVYEPLH